MKQPLTVPLRLSDGHFPPPSAHRQARLPYRNEHDEGHDPMATMPEGPVDSHRAEEGEDTGHLADVAATIGH